METNKDDIQKNLKRANIIFIFGIIFLVASPLLFTQRYFWSEFNFSETGQIGDTIGGITAPIANLLGAILVYFAFRAQVQANQLIQFQLMDTKKYNEHQLAVNEFNILNQDFELIKKSLEGLKFEISNRGLPENIINEAEKSNGLDYINLFGLFFRSIVSNDLLDASDKETKIGYFRITVLYPLFRVYKNLGVFLTEIIENEILIERYKKKFYLKIEQQLLQHYLRICNNSNYSGIGGQKEFVLETFNSPVFNVKQFMAINNTFISNKLFQLNDLEFYKMTK